MLQNVLGKGKGLVTIEKISKSTRILFKKSIITVPYNKLDSKQLQTSIC